MAMLPFRSILCPVDFSAHAAHALRHAASLAALARARLTVAWVADPLLAQAASVYALDPKGEQARADLRQFVAEALPLGASWLPETGLVITVGTPEQEILRMVQEHHADLVVMGTHGLSGYRKMFFGSTTERVLRQTATPVLAVPIDEAPGPARAEGPRFDVGTIIVALDLSEESAALAEFGVRLATALDAHPLFLHVVPATGAPARWQSALQAKQQAVLDHARHEMSRLADLTKGDAIETEVAVGSPPETIAAHAAARHAGLIVMGLRSRQAGTTPGSIAYRVLVLSPTPVLVVPPLLDKPGHDAPESAAV